MDNTGSAVATQVFQLCIFHPTFRWHFFFFFVLLIYARLTTTKGAIYKFDGFVDTDLEKIKPYIEGPYENELDIVPLATKGWNWGEVDFQGKMLRSHSRFERFDPDLVYN